MYRALCLRVVVVVVMVVWGLYSHTKMNTQTFMHTHTHVHADAHAQTHANTKELERAHALSHVFENTPVLASSRAPLPGHPCLLGTEAPPPAAPTLHGSRRPAGGGHPWSQGGDLGAQVLEPARGGMRVGGGCGERIERVRGMHATAPPPPIARTTAYAQGRKRAQQGLLDSLAKAQGPRPTQQSPPPT